MIRIGIDIGGTFTDFVVYDPETARITTFKLLTNSSDPASTIIQGLETITSTQPMHIIHGSTVATNALLERKGAHTALITTCGFKDVLQIGRQNRPNLYNWAEKPAPPLVPQELRYEVQERVDFQGNVLCPVDPAEVDFILKSLTQQNIESVAVCLLFSFLHPQHEQIIVKKLRESGFSVSASSEILPEFREYERTSTTVVNAYVSPILNRYLTKLATQLPDSSIQIMQSNGGMISLQEARQNGVRCILSGPAGGIVGAQAIAQNIISDDKTKGPGTNLRLITFDMGGTSTDVSLIDGQPSLTTEAILGGCPIHLPVLDIHTIGAGGGSIVYLDAGGSLRVGTQSAGADPGPACYGWGDLPTVTDANLVLGRILPDRFLGGRMKIYPERALSALSQIGASLNMTAEQVAQGVIEVVNAQMEHALRVISVERGYDPQDFNLFSFGGAGGLHAVELARRMGIPTVIISRLASTLSAFGMLTSNVIKDYVKTVMQPGSVAYQKVNDLITPLITQGMTAVSAEGIDTGQIEIQPSLDVRFSGQSYEINVPFTERFIQDFHQTHELRYGYTYSDKIVEIVNLRVRVIGKIETIQLPELQPLTQPNKPEPMEYIPIHLSNGLSSLPVYEYEQLIPGFEFIGPALIVSADTTILIDRGDRVSVDSYLNLLVEINPEDD